MTGQTREFHPDAVDIATIAEDRYGVDEAITHLARRRMEPETPNGVCNEAMAYLKRKQVGGNL